MAPPSELVQQWADEWCDQCGCLGSPIAEFPFVATKAELPFVATKAAQWGWEQRGAVNEAELQKARDEELDACCEQLRSLGPGQRTIDSLRALRRPKPKSQAEEALNALDDAMIGGFILTSSIAGKTIRAALERLRELEQSNG